MIRWYARLSIQSRLLLIFSSLLLLGAIGLGAGVLAVTRLGEQVKQGFEQTDTIQSLAGLDRLIMEQQLAIDQFAQRGDPLYLRRYSNLELELDYQFRLALSQHLDEGGLITLQHIAADLEKLNRMVDPFLASVEDGEPLEPESISELSLAYSQENARLRLRLQDISAQQQANKQATITKIRTNLTWLVYGGAIILAAFVVFVLVVMLVVNDIADPILNLAASISAYQNGCYQPTMIERYLQREDELGILSTSLDQLIQTVQQQNASQERLLASLARFFPSPYLDLLHKKSIEEIQLGDHINAEMAVLFTDIRSFTTISEKMTASQNFDLVNNYLKRVSPVVKQHNGFIVKFLGDGMMAVFPYHVDDALQAGLEKLRIVEQFRQEILQQHGPHIQIGVGIHTGHMMVGMIGEEQRLQGDAFSDNVNLTARIEGLTRFFDVSLIISGETLARLEAPDRYALRSLGLVQVKGRQKPISLYEIFDADPDEVRRMKRATLADYQAGLKAYQLGQFEQAVACFERVLDRAPQDHPPALYLERARRYQAQGAPPGWEGVEIMDSK